MFLRAGAVFKPRSALRPKAVSLIEQVEKQMEQVAAGEERDDGWRASPFADVWEGEEDAVKASQRQLVVRAEEGGEVESAADWWAAAALERWRSGTWRSRRRRRSGGAARRGRSSRPSRRARRRSPPRSARRRTRAQERRAGPQNREIALNSRRVWARRRRRRRSSDRQVARHDDGGGAREAAAAAARASRPLRRRSRPPRPRARWAPPRPSTCPLEGRRSSRRRRRGRRRRRRRRRRHRKPSAPRQCSWYLGRRPEPCQSDGAARGCVQQARSPRGRGRCAFRTSVSPEARVNGGVHKLDVGELNAASSPTSAASRCGRSRRAIELEVEVGATGSA